MYLFSLSRYSKNISLSLSSTVLVPSVESFFVRVVVRIRSIIPNSLVLLFDRNIDHVVEFLANVYQDNPVCLIMLRRLVGTYMEYSFFEACVVSLKGIYDGWNSLNYPYIIQCVIPTPTQ